MKNLVLLWMFGILFLGSCTNIDVDSLDDDKIISKSVPPVIVGESSFDLNSQKTYTIQNTPLLYTIEWVVLNATIVSENSTSVVLKFDKNVDVVNISVNVIDKTEGNYNTIYTARKNVYMNATSSSIIKGPNEISEDKEITYRLTGLSSYNYKNVKWFCDNASLLSILKNNPVKEGEYSNEVIVKRKTKAAAQVKLYAERKVNEGLTVTSVKNIRLLSLYTLDDIILKSNQSFNVAKVELLQLPEDYVTVWKVEGNGFVPYSQNNEYMLLKMNDAKDESIVNITVSSNGKERKFSYLAKPNFDVNLKIVFTYIGNGSGGWGDVYIYDENGEEIFYNEFESYGIESVKSIILKPGKYVIMGRGLPTENMQYSFEIKQGNVSDANKTMQMSLQIDDRMWHPLFTY